MDQMTQCYSTNLMTRRWTMVVFFNMLEASALNAITTRIWLKLQNSFQLKKKYSSYSAHKIGQISSWNIIRTEAIHFHYSFIVKFTR